MIVIANKRSSIESLMKKYPGIDKKRIVDVTSAAADWHNRTLSPFYPHRHIPVPFSDKTASCVEAIWQGLKCFETYGVDLEMFHNNTMKNLKRTTRRLGPCLGHKRLDTSELLDYKDARRLIYLPSYKWMLDNCKIAHERVMQLKEMADTGDLILLDYNSNPDITNLSKPLSHASLIKAYIEDNYPSGNEDYLFKDK